MSALSVTTTPVQLDLEDYPDVVTTGQTLVIQNLGAGDLYVDSLSGVSSATGIKLVTGMVWEIQNYDPARPVYLVSSGTSDVRFSAIN